MRIRKLHPLWYCFVFAFLMWSCGLVYFIALIPTQGISRDEISTEAIVILTGGRHRIETGLNLLRKDPSKRVFITGVNSKVRGLHSVSNAYNTLPYDVRDKVEFGQEATTTMGNAFETKQWVMSNNITSITLVTANYHVPRSLLEFKFALPDVHIEYYPVFTSGFRVEHWWDHFRSVKLLVKEYNKYLVVLFKNLIT